MGAHNGIVPPEADRPRPVAVDSRRAAEIRAEWIDITRAWLAKASDLQFEGWTQTFHTFT